MKFPKLFTAFALSLGFTAPAIAAPLSFGFSAEITRIDDFGLPIPDTIVVGDTLTGVVSYDTDLIGPDFDDRPIQSIHVPSDLQITLDIGGLTWTQTGGQIRAVRFDAVSRWYTATDSSTVIEGTGLGDQTTGALFSLLKTDLASLVVVDDVIPTDATILPFNTPADAIATGSVSTRKTVFDENTQENVELRFNVFYEIDISSIALITDDTLTDVPPAVPLPAAGWMLLAGLGGLIAMRRRNA